MANEPRAQLYLSVKMRENIAFNALENHKKLYLFNGKVYGTKCRILMDSGATGNFISRNLVKKLGLKTRKKHENLTVKYADGNSEECSDYLQSIPFKIQNYNDREHFDVISLKNYDMIVGLPWLSRVNPKINWRKDV